MSLLNTLRSPEPVSLTAWLAQAQHRHADAPQAVADGLRERAATLPADEDGAQALRLAEHVWLAHLGDPAGLAALLDLLPAAAWSGSAAQPDTSPAIARARSAWALATLAGLLPDIPMADGLQAWCEQALRDLPNG